MFNFEIIPIGIDGKVNWANPLDWIVLKCMVRNQLLMRVNANLVEFTPKLVWFLESWNIVGGRLSKNKRYQTQKRGTDKCLVALFQKFCIATRILGTAGCSKIFARFGVVVCVWSSEHLVRSGHLRFTFEPSGGNCFFGPKLQFGQRWSTLKNVEKKSIHVKFFFAVRKMSKFWNIDLFSAYRFCDQCYFSEIYLLRRAVFKLSLRSNVLCFNN